MPAVFYDLLIGVLGSAVTAILIIYFTNWKGIIQKFPRLQGEVEIQDKRIEIQDKRIEAAYAICDALIARMEALERRMDLLERRVDALEHQVTELAAKVDELSRKVDELAEAQRHFEVILIEFRQWAETIEARVSALEAKA